jgi:putative cardiolipin synthase
VFEIRVHGANAKEQKREFGSEVSSLHAKTFVIDEQRTYIGSLNLDPRSVVINTEIGVLIESPELAKSVGRRIAALMEPEWSYRVTLSPDGKTRWVSEDDDGSLVEFDHEPDTSWWDRFIDDLLGLLPIEKQI